MNPLTAPPKGQTVEHVTVDLGLAGSSESGWVIFFPVCLFVCYLFQQVEVLAAIQLMWTC